MKLLIKEKGKLRLNKFTQWIIYMFFYTLVLILVSCLFKSMYIDNEHYYIYSFLIVFVVYILNETVKPVLVKLTIPITGLTLGLFYPFINLFILKLADWILGSHFDLLDIWVALLISVLLSVSNFIVEGLIIKPLIDTLKSRGEKHA